MRNIFNLLTVLILSLFLTIRVFASEEMPKLIINEVMPNPFGDDTKLEWIEVKNISNQTLNLKDWKFNGVVLPDISVDSNELILLTRDRNSIISSNKMVDFNFNLINSGATLTLHETETSLEDRFSYVQSIEGKSFELLSGECKTIAIHDTSHTMGQENTSCEAEHNPTITPYPTVIYYTTYNYQDLIISAISPNPSQGSEWIEIFNSSKTEINLAGWIIRDESNKSYQLTEFVLNAGTKTRIFPTTISLNNDGDTIYLYDPQVKLIDNFSYEEVAKDQVVNHKDQYISVESNTNQDFIENIKNDIPQDKTTNSESSEKSIYTILKKPIYYQVKDYVTM